jgi:hypothetical protein
MEQRMRPLPRNFLAALGILLSAPLGAAGQSLSFGSQPVGATSGEQNVTVTAQVAGTVSSVEVVTLGVTGLDFAPGIGAMTCGSASLAVGAACTESVTFTPACPGLRVGAVVLVDSNSNVLGATYLSGVGVGGLGVLVTGNILPVAGDGLSTGPVLDGNAATAASLDLPTGIALDGAGNLYIADQGHNRIRKVSASTGLISTLAGNGDAAYAGDGLPSTDAGVSLNAPSSVALDGAGNVYIADAANNRVRVITAATGVISTVAGTGAKGSGGDGFAATAATLNQPQGVSVDSSGNLYIADTANHRIRKVDGMTGIITTVAGDGFTDAETGAGGYAGDGGKATQAELNFPYAATFDAAGDMYIPDSANNVVRMVAAVSGAIAADSLITTFAGTGASGDTGDGAAATLATLSTPVSAIADAAGNVYIADSGNNSIRKVSAAAGFISTFARTGAGEYVDTSGGPYAVSIAGPAGLLLDGSGDLYFADSGNMRIREIQGNLGLLDFMATPTRQGDESVAQTLTVENDGNAPLALLSIAAGQNTALDETATTCTAGSTSLEVNADCVVAAVFAPSAAGDPLWGFVDVVGGAVNSPLKIELIGDATLVNSTTTVLGSSANPSGFGQAVTFTATVTTGAGTGSLTGTVTFKDGANALGAPVAVNSAGTAIYQTTALGVGLHTITASYGGDSGHFSSASEALTQTVLEATSTTLASSSNPCAPGNAITFTATVKISGGGAVTPDGTVTFTDGDATLSTVSLSGSGVATYTTTALANGSHAITATYSGDAAHQVSGSISTLIDEEVLVASGTVLTSAPNPSNFGNPVTFTATVTSSGGAVATGVVDILDGGTQIGTATLTGGTGTFTTSSLALGSHTISAAYQGDAHNRPSTSAPITQVVIQVKTSTILSAVPNPVNAGARIALSATVTPAQATPTLSGTVTFTDTFNGAIVPLGSAAMGAGGVETFNPTLAGGTHSLVAIYNGDADDASGASAPVVVTVLPATSSTVLASSPDPSVADSAVTFTATVTGSSGVFTGSVVFFADGASIGSAALNATGVATLSDSSLKPGTHSITAAYAGDASNLASTPLAIRQVVDTIPTTTTLTASTAADGVSQVATVTGISGPTPTGTVTFKIGTTILGSSSLDASGVATLAPNLAAGTYSIIASYGGDALHSPSTSKPIVLAEALSPFSLTVTPASFTMAASQSATGTVTLASNGNFSDTIALACASLPMGVTCQFSSSSVSLAANSTATAQLTISTGSTVGSSSTGSVSSGSDLGSRRLNTALAGLSLPLSVFFGCLFGRLGKGRCWFCAATMLLLSAAGLLVSGCGGVHLKSAATGTYVFQVTGTGVKSNVVQSQGVTLNITP